MIRLSLAVPAVLGVMIGTALAQGNPSLTDLLKGINDPNKGPCCSLCICMPSTLPPKGKSPASKSSPPQPADQTKK